MKEIILREELEEREYTILASYAAKSREATRRFPEKKDSFRLCFQRDRDRIIYSSAFRRLQYKTQVFLIHEADFYRTRLTHTLEVMQHARTLARNLKANEDLTEAISLAHDLGHTPFGHAGERELRELMQDSGGFDHNLQSLRIVDELEKRYVDFPGLNLTWEVREGIARHSTPYDRCTPPAEFLQEKQPSIEAQIVSIADELAYCAHDLDDSLRVGLITEDTLNDSGNQLWARVFQRAEQEVDAADKELCHRRAVRHLIECCNTEVISESKRRIKEKEIKGAGDIWNLEAPLVNFSSQIRKDFDHLRKVLEREVYLHPDVLIMTEKGRGIIRSLFQKYKDNDRLLPRGIQARIDRDRKNKLRYICDYISGMTDRYAMDTYEMMFQPTVKVLSRIERR